MYQVVDRKNNKVIATYKNVKNARAKRDKLDSIYGGCRYYIKAI